MKKVAPALACSVILFILLFRAVPLRGEDKKFLIKLNPFTMAGLGLEESYLIESLIRSYLADFGEVMNYYDLPLIGEGASLWVRDPDYVLSGSVYREQDSRILTLEVRKTATGETTSSTSVHRTTGELALKVRSLVESVFSPGQEAGKPREFHPETLTEQGISGTWQGEAGIELIRLYRSGRGIAVFSSGVQMSLIYSIQNNILLVIQDSPNQERFYHPLPQPVARELVNLAEPMRWELFLYERGSSLRGKKISTGVSCEGDELEELVPGRVEEVEWKRAH